MRRREWAFAVGFSLTVAVASLVPYLAAERLAGEGRVFAGFLLNPIDGFSYLAKMRQGASGSWIFHLPYAPHPGDGAFLFTYYLFLGHVARWLGLPLITVLHAARVLGSAAMYLAAFWLYSRLLTDLRARWLAFAWTLVGSGLGWAALPSGRIAADLWVPELIPSLSVYASAHFPLASAAYVGAVASMLPGVSRALRSAVAAASGLLLSVLQPFSVVVLIAVAAAWLFWEALRSLRGVRQEGPVQWGEAALPLLAFALGALPQMGYDAWVFRTVPAFASWAAQNQTPSPPLVDYVLGLGLVGVMAAVGAASGRVRSTSEGRLLVAWAVMQGCLLYAPVGVQRRLALGWAFAVAALAGMALVLWLRSRWTQVIGFAVVIGLSLPTNLLVMSAGLKAVAAGDPALVMTEGEVGAYEWLGQHAEGSPLLLAAPETGNRLPAFAEVRVLYGHPFETPSALEQRSLVEGLFRSDAGPAEGLEVLRREGVDFVVYGPKEQALGRPAWLAALEAVYVAEGVIIFEVPGR